MNASLKKKPINLLRGWPSPSLLPAAAISAAAVKTLADPAVYVPGLQYGPDPGYQPLREALSKWLSAFYPVAPPTAEEAAVASSGDGADPLPHHPPDVNRICITGGASQNLACILQSFTDPLYTQNIWMVAPCYFLACPIYADAGFDGRLKSVPEDDEGIDLEYLRKGLEAAGKGSDEHFKQAKKRHLYRHVIYLVPTCSNPTGKTMSLRRRYDLVRLARQHDALVIADDVYDFLQWPLEGPVSGYTPAMRLPRLVDIDRALGVPEAGFGNVVSNGSFSKIVGPGVRTGWAEGSPAFAYGLSQTGSSCSGGAPSQLAAMFIAEMLASGVVQRHIDEKTRPALAGRHGLMMEAVRKHIQEPFGGKVKVRESSLEGGGIYGGYFVWFSLPEGMSSREAAVRAKETEDLVIGHGAQFEVHGDEESARFDREVRLCFSWEPEEDIVEGVERLGRVLQAMREGGEWTSQSGLDVDNVK
ncbi:aminotransferase [Colletotrichum karsti]|uniref:Aminotransferase n=1 Tax=Colletotrichum karsti TaxID=1095194 RepID=A0A9P6IF70_9PEZI|nr:aminotransferase [Colletotrichum karsti]KAF9881615.1 aminotransferase [Colletotrichum karsti]